MSIGKRIIAMSEIDAKLALVNMLELISDYGVCVSSNGKDCPANTYCNPGNVCADAWLDAATQKEV